MPFFYDRTCTICGGVLKHTASASPICLKCSKIKKREADIQKEAQQIVDWGYEKLEGPWLDKFNHRCYKLLTPCGHEWTLPFCNLIKQVKNSRAKNLPNPCGTCGPQHRMRIALEGFIEKYGIDYDLTKALDYERKVRGATDVSYKKHKGIINPRNLKRGLAGEPGAHHVDHIVGIRECFRRGWTVEQAVHPSNLQMLTWEDNLTKGGGKYGKV